MKNLFKALMILVITLFGSVELGKALADREIQIRVNNKDVMEYVDESMDQVNDWFNDNKDLVNNWIEDSWSQINNWFNENKVLVIR